MEQPEKIEINSFEELLELFESGKLEEDQEKTILNDALKVFYAEMPREEMLQSLREWWYDYQDGSERPLFLD